MVVRTIYESVIPFCSPHTLSLFLIIVGRLLVKTFHAFAHTVGGKALQTPDP